MSDGSGTSNRYGEQAEYDPNGNITSFHRRGTTDSGNAGLIDKLSFTYNGNQLESITDSAPFFPTYKDAFHYADGTGDDSGSEFEYDENGRMTFLALFGMCFNSGANVCRIRREYNILYLHPS